MLAGGSEELAPEAKAAVSANDEGEECDEVVKHCVGAAEREFAFACYAACSDLARIKSTLKPAPELEKNRSISSITSYDRNRTFLFSSSRLNVGRRSCSRRRALFFSAIVSPEDRDL
jgi:hypothetical protein